ncbi:MAG TPA: arginine--tRNA ligase [Abditibacteriaceae bacterium]|jgi:arginyl-tRNA synthetase
MQTVQQQLQNAVESALSTLGADTASVAPDALKVVPTANAQFGDYQWNGALPLAKTLKTNPRALAQQLVEKLDVEGISETPEIAGPGFINFRLKPQFIAQMAAHALQDDNLGVPRTSTPRTVVVDYSGPNVAKPMHVGHIRSTIIGDAIARLLRFSGHNVITDNHVGDWGTQFGKLIIGWKKYLDEAALQSDPIGEMERLYKLVNAQSDSDPTVADEARAETARLQNGDAENRRIWETLRELSQQQFDEIYGRLDIRFDHTLGESFYNDRLNDVVRDLKERGLARDSEGAVIVPFDAPPQLQDRPLLVQKSDGAALYGTTDLATIRYRIEQWHPDEIVYVVDARQSLHFQQVFEAARLWGCDAVLRHVSFGSILGEDGKPIKTRSGESVRLKDLLDEAQSRALEIVREKNPDLTDEQQHEVARVIGIGAVKYADLSQNRTSDYIFSWDKMLAMQGNTAPYLQYAYVRIRSIFRRAQEQGIATDRVLDEMVLEQSAEQDLAKFILRFPLAIETALSDYRINALNDYLFELAQKFTSFYDACPVLKSDEPQRSSRLALCDLTSRVLKQGLSLLGIETIEQM